MDVLKLFAVFDNQNTPRISHNKINKGLMPKIKKYWSNKGRFDEKLYERFLRIRNTEVIHTDEKKSIEVVYVHSDDVFEIRQGVSLSSEFKSDLKEPFSIRLDDLKKLYETALSIKNRQL